MQPEGGGRALPRRAAFARSEAPRHLDGGRRPRLVGLRHRPHRVRVRAHRLDDVDRAAHRVALGPGAPVGQLRRRARRPLRAHARDHRLGAPAFCATAGIAFVVATDAPLWLLVALSSLSAVMVARRTAPRRARSPRRSCPRATSPPPTACSPRSRAWWSSSAPASAACSSPSTSPPSPSVWTPAPSWSRPSSRRGSACAAAATPPRKASPRSRPSPTA